MKKCKLFFTFAILSLFLLGTATASMVKINPASVGERPTREVIESTFDSDFNLADTKLSNINFKDDDAASDENLAGIYMTAKNEALGDHTDMMLYAKVSKNTGDYDHFAALSEGLRTATNQDQKEIARTWPDYNDVARTTVPIPGAVWLLASGLFALVGFRSNLGV